MNTYRVIWEIDIDARNAPEAVAIAYQIQRDPESTATEFRVRDSSGSEVRIDADDC